MRVELYFTGGTPQVKHKPIRYKRVHRSVASAVATVRELKKWLDHHEDGGTIIDTHTPMISVAGNSSHRATSGDQAITWTEQEVVSVHA